MKFSTYEPVVGRNTINPPAVQASRDVMAYGTDGKEWDGLQAGLGQVIKVAQQQQDEDDYIALSKAKNEIRERLVSGIYGEGGLFEQGVGENAAGLTQRVEDFNKQTYQEVGSQYNGRVQRALLKDFNENAMNLQRISASKEFSARQQLIDDNYADTIDGNAQMASLNAGDAQTLSLVNGNVERAVYAYGKAKGWSGIQTAAEMRKAKTSVYSNVVQSLLADGKTTEADTFLLEHRSDFDQKVFNQLYGGVRKDAQTREDMAFIQSFKKADGTIDEDAMLKAIADKCGPDAKKWVASGGTFSGDSGLDGEITTAAQESGVDPALIAAVAQAESSFDQSAVSNQGALGVMQLMPNTAAGLGVDPNDRAQNVLGGAKYLKQLLDQYHGNVELAVAAYNAGSGNVGNDETDGHIPQNGETPAYVQRVMEYYNAYKNAGQQGTVDVSTLGLQHFRKWSSAEGMDTPWDSNGTTDTSRFRPGVAKLLKNLDQTGYDYVITGGAEQGYHADGQYSHANGYKVDISDDLGEDAVNALYQNVQALGGTIVHEADKNHYDIVIPGGDEENAGGGHWESAYDPVRYEQLIKLAKAEAASVKSEQKAKEDAYADSVADRVYRAPDGTTAVAILNEEEGNLTKEGYAKVKSTIAMKFPGAMTPERGGSASGGSGQRAYRGEGNDGELRGAALGWSNKLDRLRELAYQSMQNGRTFDDTNDDHNFENYRVALEDFLTTQYATGNDKQRVLNMLDDLAKDYESYREYWQG